MKFKLLLFFILLSVLILPDLTVSAHNHDGKRKSKVYEESRYELMTYAEDSWWNVAEKTGTATATAIKNFFWMTNLVLAHIVMMVVYQLFSLDIVEITKETVQSITASTAGSLLYHFGLFALTIAAFGIVIRAYIQQNWQAFLKLVGLVLLSMILLSSIQSENFNYIDFAHRISTSLENAIMQTNPSLSADDAFTYQTFDETSAQNVSIAIENKVFEALIYQPYLLLQYGTTDEAAIQAEDSDRIHAYLKADPATEEGMKKREKIAESEFKKYGNTHIFAGNAFKQTGYILVMILSTSIQGIVFFSIALIRILLQFAFIVMMLMVPFVLFASLFPSFESLVGRFTKGTFVLILFKGLTMFFVLIATSFITLGYEMTNSSDDLYYRIFIHIIFSITIIFLYAKRQFVFSMLEGASPTLQQMGAGEGVGRSSIQKGKSLWDKRQRNKAYKGLNQRQKRDSNDGTVASFYAGPSLPTNRKRNRKESNHKQGRSSFPRKQQEKFPQAVPAHPEVAATMEKESSSSLRAVSPSEKETPTKAENQQQLGRATHPENQSQSPDNQPKDERTKPKETSVSPLWGSSPEKSALEKQKRPSPTSKDSDRDTTKSHGRDPYAYQKEKREKKKQQTDGQDPRILGNQSDGLFHRTARLNRKDRSP
ncbi:CD3337/EF1877 family mobilome membrane protein [Thalassobacillus pellis]|uniref:CD3337/EF1877 family mobilome membrane protein n=1 Tax=Thalassobacillus pellis TaxID=748008 RepID=UPI0019601583|nr:hypothetical protein [Thalassobacillus pellis]MBM7554428.1 hypothetical protein [Thalassobacillus pellis]